MKFTSETFKTRCQSGIANLLKVCISRWGHLVWGGEFFSCSPAAQKKQAARCCGVQEVLTEESLAQKQRAPQAEQLDLVIMFATGGGVCVARRRPTLYRVLVFWRVRPPSCRKSKWAKSRSVLIETSRPPRGISPPTAGGAPSCKDWFAAGNGRNAIHQPVSDFMLRLN